MTLNAVKVIPYLVRALLFDSMKYYETKAGKIRKDSLTQLSLNHT